MLRAARRADTTVIVDETFVDLGFAGPATPAAAIDPSAITIGSLSKVVRGGPRIGWIRAQADLVQRVAALPAATDMGGALLDQLVAVELMGRLDDLAAARVAEVRPQSTRCWRRWPATCPAGGSARQGGPSLWAELDAPLSVLARLASSLSLACDSAPTEPSSVTCGCPTPSPPRYLSAPSPGSAESGRPRPVRPGTRPLVVD